MTNCQLCPRPAAWIWSPFGQRLDDLYYLCDDHAAGKDLSDLEELANA